MSVSALRPSGKLAPTGAQRLLAAPMPSLRDHVAFYGPVPFRGKVRRGSLGPLVATIDEAGLRGHGGGWFPTAQKMRAVGASAKSRRRAPVAIANGMESEPESDKDAVLLYDSPHLVLDGLSLAAEAVGASRAFIAVSRTSAVLPYVSAAVAERNAANVDRVAIELVTPVDRYVASEESALAKGASGAAALPVWDVRPFERGTNGNPTLVQNAETLAHLALIARFGAAWFRSQGTREFPGTTLISVSGAVAYPGVIEVAGGTPVSAIMQTCGGTTAPVQAYLTGGYGGAWAPASLIDQAWTPGDVAKVGGVMGASVLVALPSSDCGLFESARVVAWMAGESAGQCGPCRFGLGAIGENFARLGAGELDPAGYQNLKRQLDLVGGRGACRHPDGVARLAASALRVFQPDVAAHLRGRCAAGATTRTLRVEPPRPFPAPTPGKEWQ